MDNDILSNEQTEKVLQFQDLTGIEDISICRDVLIRHQWDLEVAIQEQLNMREGRPSMYAVESRAPQVVNDRYLQHVFSNTSGVVGATGAGAGGRPPASITGFLGYVINYVFNVCYSTLSSIFTTVLSLFKNQERSKCVQKFLKLRLLIRVGSPFLLFFIISFLFGENFVTIKKYSIWLPSINRDL